MMLRVHLSSGNHLDVHHPIHRNDHSAHADEEVAEALRRQVRGSNFAPNEYADLGGSLFLVSAIEAIEVL